MCSPRVQIQRARHRLCGSFPWIERAASVPVIRTPALEALPEAALFEFLSAVQPFAAVG